MIRPHDGHAECCLNWSVYDISVSCVFYRKYMQKMSVIAKISCYLELRVVTLKLRKEYLNTVTHATSVLLWIKNWTVRYIEAILCQHIRELQAVKNSPFLAHPVFAVTAIGMWGYTPIRTTGVLVIPACRQACWGYTADTLDKYFKVPSFNPWQFKDITLSTPMTRLTEWQFIITD